VGTIAVSIDGKPKFTWHGDEAKIARIMETYPEGAARQDMTPKELAVICIDHLVNNVAAQDDLAREAQQIGLIWLILDAESTVRRPPRQDQLLRGGHGFRGRSSR
jgi:hypothetical protein